MRAYTFHKGLRLDKPEWELQAGELPELTNFVYGDTQGLLRKRRGLSRIVATAAGASPIRGVYRASVGTSNPHTLAVTGGTVYRVLDSNPTWDPVHAGLFPGTPVRFDTWKEKVFFVNGADDLMTWDGTEVDSIQAAAAGCRFVQQFSDRLFIGSSFAFPDTLFYSDLLDYETWIDPETEIQNLIDISPGDDQKITGMVRTREQLTIFKSHSTYYLRGYDPAEWDLRRVSDSVGCIAPDSIVEMDARTIWLSDRGVYMDDGFSFFRIGAAIQPFVTTLSRAQQEKAVATSSGWHYLIFFPDTPAGSVAFAYHVRLEAWMRWNLDIPVGAVCPKDLPTDNGGWVAGNADQGRIYDGETGGTDDGADIDARLRLPSIGDQTPEAQIDLRRIALDAEAHEDDEVTLSWSVDGGDAITRTFEGERPKIYSIPAKIGQKVSLAVDIDGTGTDSLVRGLSAELRIKRRRW